MSIKLVLATTLALSTAFMPLISSAAEVEADTTKQAEMTKKAWLDQMAPMLPEVVCKGFMDDASLKAQFDKLKITKDQCMTAIPAIVSKCRDEIYANVPEMVNEEVATKWGHTLGECIGKDYAMKYLFPSH